MGGGVAVGTGVRVGIGANVGVGSGVGVGLVMGVGIGVGTTLTVGTAAIVAATCASTVAPTSGVGAPPPAAPEQPAAATKTRVSAQSPHDCLIRSVRPVGPSSLEVPTKRCSPVSRVTQELRRPPIGPPQLLSLFGPRCTRLIPHVGADP